MPFNFSATIINRPAMSITDRVRQIIRYILAAITVQKHRLSIHYVTLKRQGFPDMQLSTKM